jgi:hypothetical protein
VGSLHDVDSPTPGPAGFAGWVPWAILALAALARLLYIGEWSLWLDEETSVFFALNPDWPFPRSFPVYFWLVGALFQATGVSVVTARILTALIGVWTLWLLYRTARRFCGSGVAVPALALLSVSVGHLFWSQNIRYYVLVLAFQLLSIHAFLSAIERPRARTWILAALWFVLALATHLTAVLLLPVYATFIAWLAYRSTHRSTWATAAVLIAVFAGLSAMLLITWFGRFPIPITPDAPLAGLYITARLVLYTGLPAVALAATAVTLGWRTDRGFVFFVLLALIPLIELIVIRSTGLWFAVWYHALVASAGIAVVAGYGWDLLSRRAPVWATRAAGVALAAASLALMVVYYTVAHGDRPRWREAVLVVSRADAGRTPAARRIVGHSPGVLAHYLGIPPGETMGHPAVKQWQGHAQLGDEPAYVFVTEIDLPEADRAWLRSRCAEVVRLPSRMVVRDRTVVVFLCAGTTAPAPGGV